jgi:hypothetical protein
MSEKIYAWLLKLYPHSFRKEYAAAALQLFRDRCRVERGPLARVRLWLDILTDLALSLPREHWRPDSDWPEVEGAFHLSEEAVCRLAKRDLVHSLLFSLFIALGMTAGWLGNANREWLFSVYLSLAMVVIWRLVWIPRNERRWRAYRLIVGTDRLQQMHHGNDLTIFKNQIIRINEDQHGLRIFGLREGSQTAISFPLDHHRIRKTASSIWIPVGLAGYEQARAEVFEWTNRIGKLRAPWFQDMTPVFFCAASLLPVVLLVHLTSWFLVIAAAYYGLVLFAMGADFIRPLRRPSAHEQRHLLRSCCKPPFLVLLVLPIIRIFLPL